MSMCFGPCELDWKVSTVWVRECEKGEGRERGRRTSSVSATIGRKFTQILGRSLRPAFSASW